MPTYEYVCGSCGRRMDVLHGIHADGPAVCEVCGGRLRKAISAAAVVFKGSGWAKKDAARAAARPASDKGDGDGAPSDGSGSRDATPAAGADKAAGNDGSTGADKAAGTDKPASPEGARSKGDVKPKADREAASKTNPAPETPRKRSNSTDPGG